MPVKQANKINFIYSLEYYLKSVLNLCIISRFGKDGKFVGLISQRLRFESESRYNNPKKRFAERLGNLIASRLQDFRQRDKIVATLEL